MSVFSFNRFTFLTILLLSFSTTGLKAIEEEEASLSDDAAYIKRWRDVFQFLKTDPQSNRKMDINQHADIYDVVFDCPYLPPSASVPTNVHSLRPGDIKIVAALGDSITAGNGIWSQTPAQILIPYRGESFSVGGDQSLDEGVITLTNILRKYNADVKGFSLCSKKLTDKESGFNVAVPGATHRGLERQASDLINKLLTREGIDYYNDWKVVTLFIGGNDLCRSCGPAGELTFSPENYRNGIKAALDLLHRHVPRVFVNLQAMLDISMVPDLNHPGQEEKCAELHRFECPCSVEERENNGTGNDTMTLRERQLQYYYEIEELVNSGIYDDRSDFTVVLQPHLRDQKMFSYPNGTYDMSYVAADCFHPSVKAHKSFAYMLWNIMLTPVGAKPFEFNEAQYPKYVCPTEEKPFFYTIKNSGATFMQKASP